MWNRGICYEWVYNEKSRSELNKRDVRFNCVGIIKKQINAWIRNNPIDTQEFWRLLWSQYSLSISKRFREKRTNQKPMGHEP
jgi:hypothetical protein